MFKNAIVVVSLILILSGYRAAHAHDLDVLLGNILQEKQYNLTQATRPLEYKRHPDQKEIEEFWAGTPPRAFNHALVLTGIGLDFGVHFGIMDALEDLGLKPDLLIATCGGALTAGIHRAFPDAQSRLEFILSEDFHQFIVSAYQAVDGGRLNQAKYLRLAIRAYLRRWGLNNRVMNFFRYKIAEMPEDAIFEELSLAMDDTNGVRYIIIASRTDLTPGNIRNARIRGRKYYNEVLFTDRDTAKHLVNYQSPIGLYFPESLVRIQPVVKTGRSFGMAIRMGISDPYIFAPGLIDDKYYLTGGINLHPIELALGLAHEVSFALRDGFGGPVNAVTDGGAFQYDTRCRQKLVTSKAVNRWIDLTDRSNWRSFGFSLIRGLTNDHPSFKEMIKQQYILGYIRTAESICLPVNYKGHIRNATNREMHRRVRRSVARKTNLQEFCCHSLMLLQRALEDKFAVELPSLAP